MAVLSKGTTFATGNQVTATNLNALVDSATFATGAVDDSTTQLSGGAIIVKDGGITSAKLASSISTGTITATTQLIGKGTATNDSPSAGYIGEHTGSIRTQATAISLTTETPANVTSISLTAGDWDVAGAVQFIINTSSGVSLSYMIGSTSTTSATHSSVDTARYAQINYPTTNLLSPATVVIPEGRISLAATTTVYLVAQCAFNIPGEITACGSIRARRAR